MALSSIGLIGRISSALGMVISGLVLNAQLAEMSSILAAHKSNAYHGAVSDVSSIIAAIVKSLP
jgi:hypothetical protein